MRPRLPEDQRWNHCFGQGAGVRLRYVRHGHGRPVLLLHGWPGFWFDWREVILPLASSFDVVAPDFRGFGGSDAPELPIAQYGPRAHALDVLHLMDHLNFERVVIAGHDIGATVAQAVAL